MPIRIEYPDIPSDQIRLQSLGNGGGAVERVVGLGGKGSAPTSSAVFEVANGLARITIDSAALSRRSSSSSNSAGKFQFSIPYPFTPENAKASVMLLLNKLLYSSSSSASNQLLKILDQNALKLNYVYTLNDVASDDLALLDFSAAAIGGVSAILDHLSSALASFADAVAAISCEALRADVSAFKLMDSGDCSSAKDAVAVAADFKVFFNGSKFVNSGKKLLDSSVSEIPSVHGKFREISRLLHLETRVQLNSGFRPGSAEDMPAALPSLGWCLWTLGDSSVRRTSLLVANLFF